MIAVAARDGQPVRRRNHVRTRNRPVVDRRFDRHIHKIRAAQHPQRGHSGLHRVRHRLRGLQRGIAGRWCVQKVPGPEMAVRVENRRHHRVRAQIDLPRAGGRNNIRARRRHYSIGDHQRPRRDRRLRRIHQQPSGFHVNHVLRGRETRREEKHSGPNFSHTLKFSFAEKIRPSIPPPARATPPPVGPLLQAWCTAGPAGDVRIGSTIAPRRPNAPTARR